MAISFADEYNGQVDIADANYPEGKPRNDTSLASDDGTPLEERWVQDLAGFQQFLLKAVTDTPSGTPDHATASQYADAIRELTRRPSCSFDVSASATPQDAAMSLALKTSLSTSVAPDPVFSVTGGDTIVVPDLNRWYLLLFHGVFTSSAGANPALGNIDLGSSNPVSLSGWRWAGTTSQFFPVQGAQLHHPGLWGSLQVINRSAANLTGTGRLTVVGMAKLSGHLEVW